MDGWLQRATGSAACRPLQRARSGAGGRRVPTTTASEIRRRWCVKKDVLRAVCGWASCEGAHSLSSTIKTTCIRARRVDDALLWFVWGYLGFFLSRCRASRAMSLNSIRASLLSISTPTPTETPSKTVLIWKTRLARSAHECTNSCSSSCCTSSSTSPRRHGRRRLRQRCSKATGFYRRLPR